VTTYYYGINEGKNRDTAVVGTSTNSTDVEITVNGANVTDKQAAKIAIENLIDYIVQLGFPPL
jgi:hypothetical protein